MQDKIVTQQKQTRRLTGAPKRTLFLSSWCQFANQFAKSKTSGPGLSQKARNPQVGGSHEPIRIPSRSCQHGKLFLGASEEGQIPSKLPKVRKRLEKHPGFLFASFRRSGSGFSGQTNFPAKLAGTYHRAGRPRPISVRLFGSCEGIGM